MVVPRRLIQNISLVMKSSAEWNISIRAPDIAEYWTEVAWDYCIYGLAEWLSWVTDESSSNSYCVNKSLHLIQTVLTSDTEQFILKYSQDLRLHGITQKPQHKIGERSCSFFVSSVVCTCFHIHSPLLSLFLLKFSVLFQFSQRSIKVWINNSSSESYNIFSGISQGSVISPVLFNIMIW